MVEVLHEMRLSKAPRFFQSQKKLPLNKPLTMPWAQFVSWDAPIQPSQPKSLTVALIGPPNAGKSSLLNAFLGVTVSAVSNKVNTTRTDFRGMVTKGNNQLIFVDAPGIIESHPKKTFCRDLVNAAWRGYEDADLGILVVDTVKRPTQNIFNVVRAIAPKPSLALSGFQHSGKLLKTRSYGAGDFTARSREEPPSVVACSPSLYEMREAGISGTLRQRLALDSSYAELDGGARTIPIILCLNKIDLASHPRWIYAREKEFGSHGHFQRAFHVSAKYRRGTELLMDYLFNQAVSRPWTYPSDMRTSLSKVQQVEELIRTYLFCWFNKDVPYRVTQETVGWATQEDGSVVIEQELLVKSDQVAKMICGIRGRILLQMRKNVTYKLEQLWGHKVFLYIHVKRVVDSDNRSKVDPC
ncbi:GTP-binding protein of era related protein [Cyclospora cayetanensis]|uniref:GTP-binding protein of era related protein n=1 Tax=Cyclospora cayetanensis TaxID=88456 RepID=A0A1D3CVY8_9EIME|nr:GTP-binding protein of era related protein [Cyclospora cayetanensis]